MKVELLNNPDEKLAEIAIRMCRGKKNIPMKEEVNSNLIKRVIDSGHESVAEHVNYTFRISDISRVTSHQLVRHRIASYSQESQRYADPFITSGEDWAVIPDSIIEIQEAEKATIELLKTIEKYREKMDKLKVPLEDSRYFLPNATKTAIIVTMNARTLWNFFDFRICTRAQWEIRRLAKMMLHLVKDTTPSLFSWWRPRCNRGCPEKCDSPVSLSLEKGTTFTGKMIEYLPKQKD
jgi:thymidylate synthase (FAD)